MIRTFLPAALAALPAALAALAVAPIAPGAYAAVLTETFDGDTLATTDFDIASRDGEAQISIVSQSPGDDALSVIVPGGNEGDLVRGSVTDDTAFSSFNVSAEYTAVQANFTVFSGGVFALGTTGTQTGYQARVVTVPFTGDFRIELLDGTQLLGSSPTFTGVEGSTFTIDLSGVVGPNGDLLLSGTNGTQTVTATVDAADVSFGDRVFGFETGNIFGNNGSNGQVDNVTVSVVPVPEPGTAALAAGGAALLLGRRRRA